ncbi:dynactin subunit 6 isoform X1 [Ixodes scapularis]|uniref:Dynactin subunit 6 n=1 Tax=Ixodes ricinus TaxID=34613 RepID=A0A6B0V194_IXORI|nr:dynactin subunit 6 isoform X1 [Ixodes scapularis]
MAAAPKASVGVVKIYSGAVVTAECEIKGNVTIGSRTVVHPAAHIIAEAGPIIIGENNLIEEQVYIYNRRTESDPPDAEIVMTIGNNNVFEVGSYSESLNIGNNNVLESKSKLGRNTELTSGCVIGAMCEVYTNEKMKENTVVYGRSCERRIQNEKPATQTLQLDFLTKVLPNYHYFWKPTKGEQVLQQLKKQ